MEKNRFGALRNSCRAWLEQRPAWMLTIPGSWGAPDGECPEKAEAADDPSAPPVDPRDVKRIPEDRGGELAVR